MVLADSLNYVLNEHKASLIAYVFMLNHIHLITHLPEGESISEFMRDFKRQTSTKIKRFLEEDGRSDVLTKLKELGRIGSYKLWTDRFDDLILTTEKQFEIKINYIHNNPVKAGLVKEITEWKYSSARNYYLGDNSVLEINKFL